HADLTRVWVATDRDRVIGHAGLDAFEAADALRVLEHGQLAVHRQSIGWTDVDASPASDTRLITDLDDRRRCEHDKIVMPLLFFVNGGTRYRRSSCGKACGIRPPCRVLRA